MTEDEELGVSTTQQPQKDSRQEPQRATSRPNNIKVGAQWKKFRITSTNEELMKTIITEEGQMAGPTG